MNKSSLTPLFKPIKLAGQGLVQFLNQQLKLLPGRQQPSPRQPMQLYFRITCKLLRHQRYRSLPLHLHKPLASTMREVVGSTRKMCQSDTQKYPAANTRIHGVDYRSQFQRLKLAVGLVFRNGTLLRIHFPHLHRHYKRFI
jgi:hypothetical protein